MKVVSEELGWGVVWGHIMQYSELKLRMLQPKNSVKSHVDRGVFQSNLIWQPEGRADWKREDWRYEIQLDIKSVLQKRWG